MKQNGQFVFPVALPTILLEQVTGSPPIWAESDGQIEVNVSLPGKQLRRLLIPLYSSTYYSNIIIYLLSHQQRFLGMCLLTPGEMYGLWKSTSCCSFRLNTSSVTCHVLLKVATVSRISQWHEGSFLPCRNGIQSARLAWAARTSTYLCGDWSKNETGDRMVVVEQRQADYWEGTTIDKGTVLWKCNNNVHTQQEKWLKTE